MKRILRNIFILWIIGLLCISCSQDKNTFISTQYHNTTARYNAYFLAKERMLLVEDKMWDKHNDDYNRVIDIYADFDSTFANSVKEDLDYIFEYASIAPQKHKNSQWVDDSYVLAGKCKFYETKYDTANTLFKYVNTKSEDENTRALALVYVLRSHLRQDNYKYARQVFDYISRMTITDRDVKKETHLVSAYFHRYTSDWEAMLEEMIAAEKLIRKKYMRSRANFIIAQLHQKLNQDEQAYIRYRKALKRNPPYEIEFFSKLYISQVSKLDNASKKKIYKYFDKLLDDAKNEEYRDKIYYEMAKFELKQGNLSGGLANINESLDERKGTEIQKAYSYLLAGETFYNRTDISEIKKYKTAKLYYDSTVATMSDEWPEYEDIKERQNILEEFVKEITIVETEDSLQRMARMAPQELDAYIAEAVAREEEMIRRQIERQKREAEQAKLQALQDQMDAANTTVGLPQNTSFPFFSPSLLVQAQQGFLNRWGSRPLEDNWRRSDKEVSYQEPDTVATIDSSSIESSDNPNLDGATAAVEEEAIKVDPQKYYAAIPKTEQDFKRSNERIEASLYNLGKIYYLRLNEPENAITTFQRLLNEYPENEHYAEVLYFLFLICETSTSCSSDDYKNELIEKFPYSLFAKLAQNPNYLRDNKEGNALANDQYQQAYQLYKSGNYILAQEKINATISAFPKASSLDKMHLLRIMCYVKKDQGQLYKEGLEWFIEEFKTSELNPFAVELLEQYNEVGPPPSLSVLEEYERSDSLQHYIVGVFNNEEVKADRTKSVFDEFHNTYYKENEFSTIKIDYSKEQHFIVVKSLNNYEEAREYLDKLIHYNEFGQHYKNIDFTYYIVSSLNYVALINKKDLDGYREFYRRTY